MTHPSSLFRSFSLPFPLLVFVLSLRLLGLTPADPFLLNVPVASPVTVCSSNCTFNDFDTAFNNLTSGDTIIVKEGYITLTARTVTLTNITIWYGGI